MTEREDIVAALVSAADGELVGRVRLQKTLYLLERLGFGTSMSFEYHHYGPYSRELDNATGDAKAFGLIQEKLRRRASDGASFSVFSLKDTVNVSDDVFGDLGKDRTHALVHQFKRTNVTVLELAATIDWLWRFENISSWREEVTRRKGKKVLGGRLERAIELLEGLGLSPPAGLQPRLFRVCPDSGQQTMNP